MTYDLTSSCSLNNWRESIDLNMLQDYEEGFYRDQFKFSVWKSKSMTFLGSWDPKWQQPDRRNARDAQIWTGEEERPYCTLEGPSIPSVWEPTVAKYNWSLNFNKTPQKKMNGQESSQTKFIWSVAILQLVMVGIYWLLLRYDENAHPFNHHHKEECIY